MCLKNQHWNEWFAGIVDGDGCFYINKKKEISFEITTASIDVRVLSNIKNQLKAGSIKVRSGSNSIRYRVKTRHVIQNILMRLNGKLHNPARVKQFQQACFILNIPVFPTAGLITNQNGYLSGLIDSDGTICILVSKSTQLNSQKLGKEGKIERLSKSRGFNQLSLKITTLYKSHVLLIQQSYKLGQIYCEKSNVQRKSPNLKYNWTITNYKQFILLYHYLKTNPLKSVKMHRIRLILCYFKYKQLKYHLKNHKTVEYKLWLKFCKSWFKYSV